MLLVLNWAEVVDVRGAISLKILEENLFPQNVTTVVVVNYYYISNFSIENLSNN